jgi:hypothetical protein
MSYQKEDKNTTMCKVHVNENANQSRAPALLPRNSQPETTLHEYDID